MGAPGENLRPELRSPNSQGKTEIVGRGLSHRHSPEGAVQVGTVDEAELGISPVQLLLLQINGQPIRPINVGVYDDLPGTAVHPRPLDPGRFPPVSPVHVPSEEEGVKGKTQTDLRMVPIPNAGLRAHPRPVRNNE